MYNVGAFNCEDEENKEEMKESVEHVTLTKVQTSLFTHSYLFVSFQMKRNENKSEY